MSITDKEKITALVENAASQAATNTILLHRLAHAEARCDQAKRQRDSLFPTVTWLAARLSEARPDLKGQIMEQIESAERAFESVASEPAWQDTPPTEPGPWEVACDETGNEPSLVEVFERSGGLWVCDQNVGAYPLQMYHDNLIAIRWRKAVATVS